MSELSELFEDRRRSYSEYSNKILEMLEDNVIPAVLSMMLLSEQELDKLEWVTVQITDDHLVLTGTIKYEEGDIISDEETVVTLDALMALTLDKVIRVAVPYSLACTGTKTDILEHLKAAEKQLRDEYETVYGHEPETLDDIMKEAMQGQLGMDFRPEFDYNDLTDEQKEALYITMAGSDVGDKMN